MGLTMPRPKTAVVVPAPTVRRRGPGRPSGTLEQSVNEAIVNAAVHHIVAVRRKKGGEITHVKHIKWGWMAIGDYYLLDEFHKLLPLVQEVIRAGYQIKSWLWNSSIEIDALASGFKVPYGLIEAGLAFGLYTLDTKLLGAIGEAEATYQSDLTEYNAALAAYNAWVAAGKPAPADWKFIWPGSKYPPYQQPTPPAKPPDTLTYQVYQVLDWLALALPFGEFYYLYRMANILGVVGNEFMNILDPGGGDFGLPKWVVDMVPGLAILAGTTSWQAGLGNDIAGFFEGLGKDIGL